MILTAVIVVVFFLAIVASLAALAQHGPALWSESVEKAKQRRGIAVLPTENVSPRVSAYESEVSPVSEFVSPLKNSAETAIADALARLIIAEELNLTTAVKIGCGQKSGEGYQKWSRLVKSAIERQKQQVTPIAQRATPATFASDKL